MLAGAMKGFVALGWTGFMRDLSIPESLGCICTLCSSTPLQESAAILTPLGNKELLGSWELCSSAHAKMTHTS